MILIKTKAKHILTALLIGWTVTPCLASFSAGVGMGSIYATRRIPTLHAGLSGQRFGVFLSSGGARTSSYYYNGYTLNLLAMWNPGDFLWGKITAGFGVGLFYAAEGYKASGSSVTDTYNDWTAGPAIRLNWSILKPVFVAVEAMYGMRQPVSFLFLSAQDITNLSIGIQL